MFLFTKRTKNVIKFVWGMFAVLIIISMVITYSGLTLLARTPSQAPATLPPAPNVASTLPPEGPVAATSTADVGSTITLEPTTQPGADPASVPVPEATPAPTLDFSL